MARVRQSRTIYQVPTSSSSTIPGPTASATLIAELAETLIGVTGATLDESMATILARVVTGLEARVGFVCRYDTSRSSGVVEYVHPVDTVPGGPGATRVFSLLDPSSVCANQAPAAWMAAAGRDAVLTVTVFVHDALWGWLTLVRDARQAWTENERDVLHGLSLMAGQLIGRLSGEARVRHLAEHDELTGLANRRAMLNEMSRRRRGNWPIAVAMLDLDRFKLVNDSLGHAVGDQLLLAVAQILTASVRETDLVARFGGDEFVVLLDAQRGVEAVCEVAERILAALAAPMTLDGHQVNPMGSIGVAFSQGPDVEGAELLSRADVAMYRAKSLGRNRLIVEDAQLRSEVALRAQLLLELEATIAAGGLTVHYQPEVDLMTGRVLAFEALVRWHHPGRGLLTAGEFVPLAEEAGLASELGNWVLEAVITQLGQWIRARLDLDFTVAVNLSAADLSRADLVARIEGLLATHRVPASRLGLEITERVAITSLARVTSTLAQLRALGISIAIDDFGTGYASLSELKVLPIDFVKLDGGFIAGLTRNSQDQAIVKAVIRLAHDLGLTVIAEGIEDHETQEALLTLGCRRGQGRLFSMARAADDLALWLPAAY